MFFLCAPVKIRDMLITLSPRCLPLLSILLCLCLSARGSGPEGECVAVYNNPVQSPCSSPHSSPSGSCTIEASSGDNIHLIIRRKASAMQRASAYARRNKGTVVFLGSLLLLTVGLVAALLIHLKRRGKPSVCVDSHLGGLYPYDFEQFEEYRFFYRECVENGRERLFLECNDDVIRPANIFPSPKDLPFTSFPRSLVPGTENCTIALDGSEHSHCFSTVEEVRVMASENLIFDRLVARFDELSDRVNLEQRYGLRVNYKDLRSAFITAVLNTAKIRSFTTHDARFQHETMVYFRNTVHRELIDNLLQELEMCYGISSSHYLSLLERGGEHVISQLLPFIGNNVDHNDLSEKTIGEIALALSTLFEEFLVVFAFKQ